MGKAGTPEKLQAGPLPKAGEWVRLEVEIATLHLKPGATFDGLAFTQYGGTAYWDRSGVASEDNPAADPQRSQLAWEKENQGKALKDPVPKEIQQIFRSVPPKERKPEQTAQLRKYYLTEVCATTRPQFDAPIKQRNALEDEKKKEEAGVVKTFIMHDVEPRRPTFVMIRGQYDKPGDPVQP